MFKHHFDTTIIDNKFIFFYLFRRVEFVHKFVKLSVNSAKSLLVCLKPNKFQIFTAGLPQLL